MNDLERRAAAEQEAAVRQIQQNRVRNARAAIARDEAALERARTAGDLHQASMLVKDLANRRIYLAELLGHAPAVNWRAR